VLLDFEVASIGPREWDLLPTAIATERYGLEEAQYRQFADTYGFDVRTWGGYPVLREIREVTVTTWIMQNVGESLRRREARSITALSMSRLTSSILAERTSLRSSAVADLLCHSLPRRTRIDRQRLIDMLATEIRAVPMGATSLTRRSAPQQEGPIFAWSGKLCGYLRLRPQPTRPPPSSARTPDPNWRAMLFAAAAAVLCCCTRPRNPVIGFSNYSL